MSAGANAQDASNVQKPGLSLESLWAQLRTGTLLPLLIAGAAGVALIIAILLWASTPSYRVLFSNIGEADGGRILAELEQRGVPYRFSEGGQAIMVPGNQVHALRLHLAEKGLPQGGNVGFELMDKQAFGISQFSEQINFQRSMEGELARSIESLGPVARARIHLALTKPSVFVREREPAKASVVLTLQPGRTLGSGQVGAIAHLVASSIQDLSIDNVTVVNQNGQLLSHNGAASDDLDRVQLGYTQDVERIYRERIENILSPLFGNQNIRVQVAAQMDYSRREETSERYTPNQSANQAAVRSAQLSTAYDGGTSLAGGIPGALSNSPPAWAPSPLARDDADNEAKEELEAVNNLRYDNVVNYEVDRSITHIQHQRGQLERLSVAVVVNHRNTLDEQGNSVTQPLNEEEIDQVGRLVRQAMGFSLARGDALEVVNSQFMKVVEEDEALVVWWQNPDLLMMMQAIGRYLGAGILILLVYLLILRPLIKRHLAQPLTTKPRGTAGTAGSLLAVADDDDDADSEQGPTAQRPRRKAVSYEQSLNELRQIAHDDPRLVAMTVRSWMQKK